MEWGARLSRSLARCVIKRGKKFISIYSHFANFSEVGSTVGTPLIYMWRSWVTTDRSVMSHDHMLFALHTHGFGGFWTMLLTKVTIL